MTGLPAKQTSVEHLGCLYRERASLQSRSVSPIPRGGNEVVVSLIFVTRGEGNLGVSPARFVAVALPATGSVV